MFSVEIDWNAPKQYTAGTAIASMTVQKVAHRKLLREIAALKRGFAADPEIQASEAFAKQLQLRAQQLKSQ